MKRKREIKVYINHNSIASGNYKPKRAYSLISYNYYSQENKKTKHKNESNQNKSWINLNRLTKPAEPRPIKNINQDSKSKKIKNNLHTIFAYLLAFVMTSIAAAFLARFVNPLWGIIALTPFIILLIQIVSWIINK